MDEEPEDEDLSKDELEKHVRAAIQTWRKKWLPPSTKDRLTRPYIESLVKLLLGEDPSE